MINKNLVVEEIINLLSQQRLQYQWTDEKRDLWYLRAINDLEEYLYTQEQLEAKILKEEAKVDLINNML